MTTGDEGTVAGPTTDIGACPADEVIDRIAGGGEPTAEVRAHLEKCARCRAEIAAVHEGERFLSGFLAAPTVEMGRSGAGENELDISPDLLPGYRMMSLIHSGGQGVVYRAVQESTGRTVAVKMLLAGRFATAAQRRRFEREAEVAAALDHPGIVRIFDSRAVRGGRHALIMECVEGVPLSGWTPPAKNERDRLRAWVRLIAEVCDAVEHAHRNGVIHRDLKPSNVLIDGNGRARVVDFGVARPLREEGVAITQTGEFAGSLEYASPEQVLEARDGGGYVGADARSDVYSTGVMLYERLCGTAPYPTEGSILDVVRRIVEEPARRPSTLNPAIDRDLETIVLLALHKDRTRRYQTAGTLGADLRRYLAGEAIEARRDNALYVIRKLARKHRAPLAVMGVMMAVLAWLLVLAWMARMEAEQRRQVTLWNRNLSVGSTLTAGRLSASLRRGPQGESMLWSALLDTFAPNAGDEAEIELVRSSAVWALRELYAKDPCVRTVQIGSVPRAAAVFESPDGKVCELRWVDAAGDLRKAGLPSMKVGDSRSVGMRPGEACEFNATGTVLAAWGGGRLRWHDAETGRSLGEIRTEVRGAPAVSMDGRTIAWLDREGRVGLSDGVEQRKLGADGVEADALGWSRSALAVLGRDGVVRLFDPETGRRLRAESLEAVDDVLEGSAARLGVSSDGGMLTIARGSGVWVWDVAAPDQRPVRLAEQTIEPATAVMADNGSVARVLCGGDRGRLMLWSAADGRAIGDLIGHSSGVRFVLGACRARSDGMAVSIDEDGWARVWQLDAGPRGGLIGTDDDSIVGLAWCGPDSFRAWTGDGHTSVWRAEGSAWRRIERKRTQGTTEGVGLTAVAEHPEAGLIAEARADGSIVVKSTFDGREIAGVTADQLGGAIALAWNDRGTQLAACGSGQLAAWWALRPTSDGSAVTLSPVSSAQGRFTGISFGADGSSILTTSSTGVLAVHDMSNGRMIVEDQVSDRPLAAMCESAGAGWVAASTGDGLVLLDRQIVGGVISWVEPREFGTQRSLRYGKTLCAAASPDGRMVALGDHLGGLRLWDLHAADRHIVGNAEAQISRRRPFDRPIDESAARRWIEENLGRADDRR
ncbi:MAG: WD40 repeat domain-containing serine/threonine protein kinase [Phycisphaerales bacterium]